MSSAPVFSPTASAVLDGGITNRRLPGAGLRYLAVSAFAWKASLRIVEERTIDPFERLLLELLAAGIRDTAELHRKSRLPEAFLEHLIGRFEKRAWIGADRAPSATGLSVLKDETERRERTTAGYFFQDPSTGVLWNVFAEGGLPQAAMDNSGTWPSLVVDTFSGSYFRRVFFLHPEDVLNCPPGAEDAQRALRDWSSSLKGLRRTDGGNDLPAPTSGRIQGGFSSPVPVYLLCGWTHDEESTGNCLNDSWLWSTTGAQAEPWARRAILDRLARNDFLRQHLNISEREDEADMANGKTLDLDFETLAEESLAERLNAEVPAGALSEAILDLECQILLRERAGPDANRFLIRNVLREARCVVEEALTTALQDSGSQDAREALSELSREELESLKSRAEQELGLTGVPPNVLAARPDAALDPSERGWRLRESAALCLLVAASSVHNSIRSAVGTDPELFWRVERVASQGGNAAHAGSSTIGISGLGRVIEDVRSIIEALFPNGGD